jgi:polyphosphate:AMP phosphotransferase
MFESAELGHKISKAVYAQELPALREALLDVQIELNRLADFSVIILLAGVDGAGRGETVNVLNEWMDPRHIQTHGMGEPTDDELQRPEMWRFWQALPPKGKIGMFLGSWYTAPILNRVSGKMKSAGFDHRMENIARFEEMLSNEGALILKFWMHLSKPKQEVRLKTLEKSEKTSWRVTSRDWAHFKLYDKFRKVSERAISHTSTAESPWIIVEGEDSNYRSLTVGKIILNAIRQRIEENTPAKAPETHVAPLLPAIDNLHILQRLNLNLKIEKKKYEKLLEKYQGKLNLLMRHPQFQDMSVVVVFEGNDAAGKGGGIRRITQALDARHYQVMPIASPTEEERAQPYLWRFWRRLPRRGRVTIFDRSWYGRVLVERVEGYCSPHDWMRAYAEIGDFEEQMIESKTILFKFWLSISNDEQLHRFEERQKTGFKRFKITDEDWRNRNKWNEYEQAVCDMVDRTSNTRAPWTLVEANDKYYARIKILKTLCEGLELQLTDD